MNKASLINKFRLSELVLCYGKISFGSPFPTWERKDANPRLTFPYKSKNAAVYVAPNSPRAWLERREGMKEETRTGIGLMSGVSSKSEYALCRSVAESEGDMYVPRPFSCSKGQAALWKVLHNIWQCSPKRVIV
ncbi:hypothetical protein PoB_005109100 [Plakobranchus ocellatus]|uniref:Uncharacterized protein n=1 Tax=Plakobranchus ocellatus TaxID=259542 RepID=A0AAV4BZM6_9GAST|nr:hypothetical protein PoB_005109100 [Plakobranchus ocellatus]